MEQQTEELKIEKRRKALKFKSMTQKDYKALDSQMKALLKLFSDLQTHGYEEIRAVCNGATECMRRVRELRSALKPYGFTIEHIRLSDEARRFVYRLEETDPRRGKIGKPLSEVSTKIFGRAK